MAATATFRIWRGERGKGDFKNYETKVDEGMVAAFEVLIANNAVRNLIREGKTHQIRNVVATGMKDGMKTLEGSLSELVAGGLISYEEAAARSVFPKEIRQPHEHAAWVQRQQALAS